MERNFERLPQKGKLLIDQAGGPSHEEEAASPGARGGLETECDSVQLQERASA